MSFKIVVLRFQERRLQMKMKLFAALILCTFLGAAGAASAGPIAPESGTMFGRVSDLDGNPLPGASVSLVGPALMGLRSSVTSATGRFFFPLIDPGVYEVRVEMPGFKIQVQHGLAVQSGRAMVVVFKMEETTVDEEVAAPAGDQPLDTRSAKVSGVLDRDVLTRTPLPRDLFHVWALVPEAVADVATDRRFVSVQGSNPRSQIVLLEGAVMNDPRTGIPAIHPPDDIIDEVEYVSAGQPAAIDSGEGTYLQIVTRRAGNSFTGGLSYYTTGASLAQNLNTTSTGTLRTQPPDRYEKYRDLSFNFGGSLMEDRAWILLAGRRMTETIANPYSAETRMADLGITDSPAFDLDRGEWTGFARLSIRPTEDIKYSGLILFNRYKEPYDIASVAADASAERVPKRSPDNILVTTHNFNFLLSPNTYADVHGTYIHRTFTLSSRTVPGTAAAYDEARKVWWGSPEYEGTDSSETFGGQASLTHFTEDLFGADHEIRFGVEYNQAQTHSDWNRTNPFNTYWYDYKAGNPYYYDGLTLGRLEIVPAPSASGDWDVSELTRKIAVFFQDTLTRKRLSLNLGIRAEYQGLSYPLQGRNDLTSPNYSPAFFNPALTIGDFMSAISKLMTDAGLTSPLSALTINEYESLHFITLSPRVGLVFDLLGNGRAALKLSFSRAYRPFWVSAYDENRILEPQTLSFVWADLNANGLMDMPGTDEYTLSSYRSQVIDTSYYADVKSPRTDTLSAGLEYEAAANLKLGLNFTWRKTVRLVEDIDSVNGNDPLATDAIGLIWLPMTVTYPGTDGKFGTADDSLLTVYGLRADRPASVWAASNPAGAYQKYLGASLTLEKRMSHNWQLRGSFTVSSLQGTVDDYSTSTLNRTFLYNDPNSLINTKGPLAYDRPIQARLSGTYILPWDISLSALFQYYSGAPWARTLTRIYFPAGYMGYGTKEPYVSVYAEPWGTNRAPAVACLDLRLEKSFVLRKGARLSLLVDVFNATGANGQTIDLDPAGVLDERKTPATYTTASTYGRTVYLYGVRQFRIGIKIGI